MFRMCETLYWSVLRITTDPDRQLCDTIYQCKAVLTNSIETVQNKYFRVSYYVLFLYFIKQQPKNELETGKKNKNQKQNTPLPKKTNILFHYINQK